MKWISRELKEDGLKEGNGGRELIEFCRTIEGKSEKNRLIYITVLFTVQYGKSNLIQCAAVQLWTVAGTVLYLLWCCIRFGRH